MEVTLLKLLQDWLDKTKYPTVSIVGYATGDAYAHLEWQGEIWVGDHSVADVYDDYVEFPDSSKPHLIKAADPNFFIYLENNIKHLLDVLKNNYE